MVQFFVPLALAFIATPTYYLKFESNKERQLTDSATECIKTTADLICKAIGSQKTRCAITNLHIDTSVKPEDPTTPMDTILEENVKVSGGCNGEAYCQPFEIEFNETGVTSLLMSHRLKNARISTIWDIANQMNFLWIQNLISNKTSVQEVTTYGKCTAEIKTEESNNDEIPRTRLFETNNFLKSGMVSIFKKIRDVDSCSKGQSKVSDAGSSSLKSFVHTVSISEYKFKSCIENKVQLSFTGKSLSDKYSNCLSVERIETSSADKSLSDIDDSDYVSVPFLSA